MLNGLPMASRRIVRVPCPALEAQKVWLRATPARCSLQGCGHSPEGSRALRCVETGCTPSDQVHPGPSRGPEHPAWTAATHRASPGLWPAGQTSGSPVPPWTWSLPSPGHAQDIRGLGRYPPGPAALARVSHQTGPGCTSSRDRHPTSCTECRHY